MYLMNSKLIQRSATGIALLGACLIAGCEDSSGPDSPVGTYTATAFLTTPTGGQPINQLANGGTITLNLIDGGFTSGHIHIEASGGEPEFDADLNGLWTVSGSTVTLDHLADTFLRDMPLTFDGTRLTGDRTFTGGRVQVTLTR